MKTQGGSANARRPRLVMGPWYHTLPLGSLVGQVDMGFRSSYVSIDFDGIQLDYFDQWLKGENGEKRVLQDRLGRPVGVELISEARPGRDLRVSIDLRLQYLAYRELKAAVADSHARSGTVVVLDPSTGEVLAMVNQPSYNPNDRAQYSAERYRNRAVTDIYEPGSSFKPLALAAALESGRYTPTTIVDTSPGFVRVSDGLTVQDDSNLGKITLTTILARSSNVGAARVALTMEAEDIWRVLASFGIGRLTDRSTATGASSSPIADITPAPTGQITLPIPSFRGRP